MNVPEPVRENWTKVPFDVTHLCKWAAVGRREAAPRESKRGRS